MAVRTFISFISLYTLRILVNLRNTTSRPFGWKMSKGKTEIKSMKKVLLRYFCAIFFLLVTMTIFSS